MHGQNHIKNITPSLTFDSHS